MSEFQFPYKGSIKQLNAGEAQGNLFASYGIDLTTEPGRVLSSPSTLTAFDTSDHANFTGPASAFATIDDKWWASSDYIYSNDFDFSPTTGWAVDTSTGSPVEDWEGTDLCVFDGLLLASGTPSNGNIAAYDPNTNTWDTGWWQTTMGGSSLITGSELPFIPMKVGATGRLYILGNRRRVVNVTTAGTRTESGNGTLDFSDSAYRFVCMEMTSTRCWLGGYDTSSGGTGVIVEWDMSLNSNSPNRIYKVSAYGVIGIAIWDDTPIAVLSNGQMKYYNGVSFVDLPILGTDARAQLPKLKGGTRYDADESGTNPLVVRDRLMHPNGWAIIDGLPHFLLNPKSQNSSTAVAPLANAPSGIYCYDPAIGLYCRYPLEINTGTNGVGASWVADVGALRAINTATTTFLASVVFFNSINGGGETSTILYDDKSRSIASRGSFALNPFRGSTKELWQEVATLAKRFKNASDRLLLKYRLGTSPSLPIEGDITWSSTTQFTTTDTDFANVVVGDEVTVLRGKGSGSIAHVSAISYSNPTYTVTLDEAAVGATASAQSTVRVDNWRRLGTISNQRTDYHTLAIPAPEGSHTFWLKVEMRAAAGSTIEIDNILVTSQPAK
jgi:hypothetical protein